MSPVREGGAGGGWECDPDLRRGVMRANEASLSVSYLDLVGQMYRDQMYRERYCPATERMMNKGLMPAGGYGA